MSDMIYDTIIAGVFDMSLLAICGHASRLLASVLVSVLLDSL